MNTIFNENPTLKHFFSEITINNPTAILFIRLVEEHYHEQRPVTFYLEQLKISRASLQAIMLENLDLTAKALLKLFLIENIKLDLRSSELSLKNLHQKYGFKTASSFTRAIKAATGYTPSKYRALKCVIE